MISEEWIEDPCCNWIKRQQQCCAPKLIAQEIDVVQDVNVSKISDFAAVTGINGIQLIGQVMGFSKLEREAAQSCYGPFKSFWDATSDVWEVVDKCWTNVEGSWNDQFQTMVGTVCTLDSDCYTGVCYAPAVQNSGGSSGGSSSGTQTKYCKTPGNLEAPDYATPFLACMTDKSPREVAAWGAVQLGLRANASVKDIAAALVKAVPSLITNKCMDKWGGYWDQTPEECAQQKVCNWNHGINEQDKCLSPCQGVDCPDFCTSPGMDWSLTQMPVCAPKRDHSTDFWSLCDEKTRDERERLRTDCDECWRSGGQCDHCHDTWKDEEAIRERCYNAECAAFCNEKGECAIWDSTVWDCIFKDMSYSPDRKGECNSECSADGGPNPVAPKACRALINSKIAEEDTCWNLGQGSIETQHMEIYNWDWSRGPTPPESCIIRSYIALDGKPYVPPPPYGASCLPHCEKEMDSCLHNDKCWMFVEEEDKSVMDICWERFEVFRESYDACLDTGRQTCSGTGCFDVYKTCLKETKLSEDKLFAEYDCAGCDGGWSSWESRTYECAVNLNDPLCRWNTSAPQGTSQPCAQECLGELCESAMTDCQLQGGSLADCANKTTQLNQCRRCQLLHCDERCYAGSCTEAFESLLDAAGSCAGCPAEATCHPGADCYGDSHCDWRSQPEFGDDCSFACTRSLYECRHESEMGCHGEDHDRCWEIFEEKRPQWQDCVDSNRSRIQDAMTEASDRMKEYTLKQECASKELPSEFAACMKCNGDWNDYASWEATRGPACISGNFTWAGGTSSVPAGVCSGCKAVACPSLAVDCDKRIETAQRCKHVADMRICNYTVEEAKTAAGAECTNCGFSNCDWECEWTSCADLLARDQWWKSRTSDMCSGCPATYACHPEAECYLEPNMKFTEEEAADDKLLALKVAPLVDMYYTCSGHERSCAWEICSNVLKDCQLGGGSAQACVDEFRSLSVCQGCEGEFSDLMRCEPDCMEKTCNTVADSFSESYRKCLGCPADAACNPSASCFADPSCMWRHQPEFGSSCSVMCESAVNDCKHQHREECDTCWSQFDSFRDAFQQCSDAANWTKLEAEMPGTSWDKKNLAAREACLMQVAPNMSTCWSSCDGEWNSWRSWEMGRGAACLSGNATWKNWEGKEFSVPELCLSQCVAVACPSLETHCWDEIYTARQCEHRNDVMICNRSIEEAKAVAGAQCTECRPGSCSEECEYLDCASMFQGAQWFNRVFDACSNCPASYACHPGAECFVSPHLPYTTEQMENDTLRASLLAPLQESYYTCSGACPGDCTWKIQQARQCRWTDLGDGMWAHLCSTSYEEGKALVVSEDPTCSPCKQRCDSDCIENSCSEYGSWDPTNKDRTEDACGGCSPSEAQCSPGAECFVDRTVGPFTEEDASKWTPEKNPLSEKLATCKEIRRLERHPLVKPTEGRKWQQRQRKEAAAAKAAFKTDEQRSAKKLKPTHVSSVKPGALKGKLFVVKTDAQESAENEQKLALLWRKAEYVHYKSKPLHLQLQGISDQPNRKGSTPSFMLEARRYQVQRELDHLKKRHQVIAAHHGKVLKAWSHKGGVATKQHHLPLREFATTLSTGPEMDVRRLFWERVESVDLTCTSADCSDKEQLCKNFFTGRGSGQAVIDELVLNVTYDVLPWEGKDQLCERLGEMCYISAEDVKALLVKAVIDEGAKAPWAEDWCFDAEDGYDPLSECAGRCGGCADKDASNCDHCCKCHLNMTGMDAFVTERSMWQQEGSVMCEMMSRYTNMQAGFSMWDGRYWFGWEASLFGGTGGCRIDSWSLKPDKCHDHSYEWSEEQKKECWGPADASICPHPDLHFFKSTRHWREGFMDTKEECEAEACYPHPWIREEECGEVKHCQGDCPYCETDSFWDYEGAKSKMLCTIVDSSSSAHLKEADCLAFCNGTFTSDCMHYKNRKGSSQACVVTAPATGDSLREQCTGDVTLSNASIRTASYTVMKCSDFSISECGWAREAFGETMQCGIQRLECRNKQDCNQAGRCDYEFDEWQIQEAGGFCVRPWNFTGSLNPERSGQDPWSQCQWPQGEHRSYGCVLRESKTQLSCETDGGKWFKYAYLQAECEVPGFAFKPGANGSFAKGNSNHACCLQVRGSGDFARCDAFTLDETKESCEACAGTWMPIFKFRKHGNWIEGQWQKSYNWTRRSFESQNKFVPMVDRDGVLQFWEMILTRVRASPAKQYIQCRLNPTLNTLLAIATGDFAEQKLADFPLLPGEEATQQVGDYQVKTFSDTIDGMTQVDLEMSVKSADGAVASATEAGTNTSTARRLSTTSLTDSLTASCYTLVKHSDKFVGQLIGDCVVFSPSSSLSGKAEICMPISGTVPVDPRFTVDAFASNSAETYTILSISATRTTDGTKLCGLVKDAGTYCPIRRYSDYTSSSVQSAPSGCSAIESVAEAVKVETNLKKSSGSLQIEGLVTEGEVEPNETVEEESGSTFEAAVATTTSTTTAPRSFIPAPPPPPTPPPSPPLPPIPTPDPTPSAAPAPTPAPTPTSPAPSPVPPVAVPTPAPVPVPAPSSPAVPTPAPSPAVPTPAPAPVPAPSPGVPTPAPSPAVPTPAPAPVPAPSPGVPTPAPSPAVPTPALTPVPAPSPGAPTPAPSPAVPTPAPAPVSSPSATTVPAPAPEPVLSPSPTAVPTPAPAPMPAPSSPLAPTPAPPPVKKNVTVAVTTFDSSLEMDDVTAFDQQAFLESVKAGSGDDTEVEIEKVEFEVKTEYSIPNDVSEETVTASVAESNGVDVSKVSVVFTERRLSEQRRLQTKTAQVTIKTEDAAAVESIAAKAEDTSALATAMQNQGVTNVVIEVTAPPKKAVKVTTKLKSESATVAAPSAEVLSSKLQEKLGVEIQAVVENEVTTTEQIEVLVPASTTTTTTLVPAPTPTPDAPSPAPTPVAPSPPDAPAPAPTPDAPAPAPTPAAPSPPDAPAPAPTPDAPTPMPSPVAPSPAPTPDAPAPAPTPAAPSPPDAPAPAPTPDAPTPMPSPVAPSPAPTPDAPSPSPSEDEVDIVFEDSTDKATHNAIVPKAVALLWMVSIAAMQ
eukprot:TRINITY_DN1524_c0_g1_i5.p1 TRINITY_DN1524_c0_g1~~TRINITY_DN1524_c0_g1_i5.p1  ORF type:complete len:3355 (+),score=611.69 TRINITY_DN1524_c0_g1_i5:877-10065(+)